MIAYRPRDVVDFAIIGAGAAGGVVAKELAAAGFSVVLLEQGPNFTEKDYSHDERKFMFDRVLTNNHRQQPNTFRVTDKEKAVVQPAVGYGRQVGGGTVHFTGNYWRLHPGDFNERSRWGAVPGANLSDWPITYEELEPYYTKAEQELGISGLGGANPFDGPRSRPYPLPPMPAKGSGVLFDRAAKKLGLHSFPAPLAILSQPYRGRGACANCGFCEGFGCEMRAKSSTAVTVIPAALRTGRCELRTGAVVSQIETDALGRVTGVVYFDARKASIRQRAKAVVVCANGAETPRLLLLSKSARFPHGLANGHGVVGKNLMWDTGMLAMGLFEQPLNEYKGVQVTRVLHDYYDSDGKRGFFGGGGIDARFDWYPMGFALDGLPKDVPRWGSGFKSFVGEAFTRTMSLCGHTTCLPVEGNRIDLDPAQKDAWGLPALRATFKNHPDDLKTLRFVLDRQLEILAAAGARRVWSDEVKDVAFSVHLMGTCRMGNDPRTSVVNRDHQAHEVPNLFLVDGSSFVTSGRQQPTCTIQALAYRASEKMVAWARRA
ncbi:MAG: GMC family oxidoreductase [Bryobacteraceae bacterium]|nr:GMC family oxidoreductase [Bryobacteraceae bacterium]